TEKLHGFEKGQRVFFTTLDGSYTSLGKIKAMGKGGAVLVREVHPRDGARSLYAARSVRQLEPLATDPASQRGLEVGQPVFVHDSPDWRRNPFVLDPYRATVEAIGKRGTVLLEREDEPVSRVQVERLVDKKGALQKGG